MKRRSFLGAMLASFTAPYVMSGGLERGVLMPPPAKKIWLPGDDKIVQAQSMLNLYSGTPDNPGPLLATIPLATKPGELASMEFSGMGHVITTGIAGCFAINDGKRDTIRGSAGAFGDAADLVLSNECVTVGQVMNVAGRINISTEGLTGLSLSDEVRRSMLDKAWK